MANDRGGPPQCDTPGDDRGPALIRGYAVYFRRLKRLLIISAILVVAGFSLSILQRHRVRNTPQAILQFSPSGNPPSISAQVQFDGPGYDGMRYGVRTSAWMVDGMRHESIEIVPHAQNGAMGRNAVATILATPARKTGRQSDDAVELSISSSIVMKLELDAASPPCVVRHLQDDRSLSLPTVLAAGEYRLRLEWPSVTTVPSSAAADERAVDPAASRPAVGASQESQR